MAGTVLVFSAGWSFALLMVASAAKRAGCPTANGGPVRVADRESGGRLADAAEEVVRNLEYLRQRSYTQEPGKPDAGDA